jgi:RNA polymerase sigma-70 factor (ECF subfamily)
MQRAIPRVTGRAGLSQNELVQLAKQRDSAAWSEIYSQNYAPVYRYIFGRLGRKEMAEDLAAQVFLEALQSIDSYHDRGLPLLAWLYGISRNLIRNGARRAGKTGEAQAVTLDDAAEAHRAGVSLGGLDIESMDLVRAMDRLSKDQREVIVLRFFVGMSAKETGAILSKTEQAVYSLQVRAIVALRRTIAGDQRTAAKESAA